MIILTKNKSKIVLIFLIGTLIISNLNLHYLNKKAHHINNKKSTDDSIFNFNRHLPILSSYSQSLTGNGTKIDIKLHQSLLNNSEIELTNLTISNSFTQPCPSDPYFNSSFINITIDKIYAPNKTLIVEDDSAGLGGFLGVNGEYASFEARGAGFIENISMHVRKSGAGSCNITIDLYNASGGSGEIRPSIQIGSNPIVVDEVVIQVSPYYWHNFTGLHIPYNTSNTYNNTFFFKVNGVGDETLIWDGAYDVTGIDAKDEHLVYANDNSTLYERNFETVDLLLKIGFSPANKNPKPEDINLNINDTAVIGDININNKGYWVDISEYSSPLNKLNFTLSTEDWWDVYCNISRVQINYTKRDIVADSSFYFPYGGSEALWNITRAGGFNEFDSRFSNYIINYTLPSNWDHGIEVYNGTTAKTLDLSAPIIDGYKEISVLDAGNGVNWYLIANSSNLVQSIDMYISGNSIPIDKASYSYIIHFNTTFSENIFDGNINLSVYSPNNELNFTSYQSISISTLELSIKDWDLSKNITETFNGALNVQVSWNNGTAVGFNETILTIVSETETEIDPTTLDCSVIRGMNINFTFNYSEELNGPPIEGANITELDVPSGITYTKNEIGQGNYSILLNTSNADISNSPFKCNFSIGKMGFKPKDVNLTINVQLTQSQIQLNSYNATLKRKYRYNQSFSFYFNDTINNKPILGLNTADVKVYDNNTGLLWERGAGDHNWTLIPSGLNDGNYVLNISTTGINSGDHSLRLNISKDPNYNWSEYIISFYLEGNYSQIKIISLNYFIDEKVEQEITPLSYENFYEVFYDNDIFIEFNMSDIDDNKKNITGPPGAYSYSINWYNRSNANINGSLTPNIAYAIKTPDYGTIKGKVLVSTLSVGNYTLNITVKRTNYENTTLSINLTIKQRAEIDIVVSEISPEPPITAGSSLTITLKVYWKIFYNETKTDTDVLKDWKIYVTLYVNGKITINNKEEKTDANGKVTFEFDIPNDAETIKIEIDVEGAYNITSNPEIITNIQVIPEPGINLLPWIIIIGIIGLALGVVYGVYSGVIAPKKVEKQRLLSEVNTIFEDAVNLEHCLVLYKGSGTCLYFKSFGIEQINPELISGFISAVSSFGREMESQQALNEITYGDKMLLLSDGEYIRVALVLSKNASVLLRKHLKAFIDAFEDIYGKDLPYWRGQLNIFQNAGQIVDDILNTSIILPHQITYDFYDPKSLKNPNTKIILEIAEELVDETEREFFFIATVLKEVADQTRKDNSEIFLGIKELRDKRIFVPIDISSLEQQPITQQELNLLYQKILEFPELNEEERQNLLNNLTQMRPAEREAYLSSLFKKQEIITAPIKSIGGTGVIDDIKSAKKEINKLIKLANKSKKEKEFENTMTILKNAASVATSWELTKEFNIVEDLARSITVEEAKVKMKQLEEEGNEAAKEENYSEAAEKYKEASILANEMFKLGFSKMNKELKRLTNKSKEFERQS